jgi:hypothetical protein
MKTMKTMKTIKRLATTLLLSPALVSGQTQGVADNVNLSIELKSVQTITINPLQKDVAIIYDSQEKYEEGIVSRQDEHIEIFTTGGGWALQAFRGSFEFDEVVLRATPVQANPTYVFTDIALTEDPQDLITGMRGGRQKFNVTYDNSGGANEYQDRDMGVYETVVTYTLMAR